MAPRDLVKAKDFSGIHRLGEQVALL